MSIELENSQFLKFEQQRLKMENFHQKLICELSNFDQSNPLLFLELDGLKFCHVELIPERIRNRGYNPKFDPQTIVLGKKQDLIEWRNKHNLNSEEFAIEPSSFGYHIDIYGRDVSFLTGSEKNKLTEMEYGQMLVKVQRNLR